MKLIKLHLLLVITALIFTLEFLAWHWIDDFRIPLNPNDKADFLLIWVETSLAIGAFAIIVTLLTPLFSRIFLGYVSKKPDEGNEVYFFVVLTLFLLSLGLIAERHFEPEKRDTEKDITYLCDLVNENLEFSKTDGLQQEVDAICGTPEPDEEQDTPAKPQHAGKVRKE